MLNIREPSGDRGIIVYLGGGAMSGTYGAGVLKGLHELNLVRHIEKIYSGSVGSLNAAYLLSGQTELGPTIYWKDLQQGFIFPQNIWRGTLDLLKNRFIKSIEKNQAHNVVDVDYAMRVISKTKPLNLGAVLENPIDLYIKILSIRSGKLQYLRLRDFPTFELIRAAICIKPYYFDFAVINDDYYIDGTIKEPLGIGYLLDRYPDKKIVVILNEPIERGVRHYIKNLTEGIIGSLYPYDICLFKLFLEREQSLRSDIKLCLANKKVLLLYPNFSNRARPRTTSTITLKETFNAGRGDSKKVYTFIQS